MKPILLMALPIALLAGCVTGPSKVEVTRFHLAQPLAGSTITIGPAEAMLADSLAFQADADAVAAELARAGFQPVPAGRPAVLTATIRLERSSSEQPARSGLSVGFGGGFGVRRGGVSSGISVPVTKTTQIMSNAVLTLQIRRGGDPNVIWEGRAATSGTLQDATAARLARALLAGFPGPSGQTVIVKPAP